MTRAERDAGYTLVEVLVAGILTSVLVTVAATSLRALAATTENIRARASVMAESRNAIDTFARVVPYAARANTPTRVGDVWYVEALVEDAGRDRPAQCVQWRVVPGLQQLQSRSWAVGSGSATEWAVLARSVVNDPSVEPPFEAFSPDAVFDRQRVALELTFLLPDGQRQYVGHLFTLRNERGGDDVAADAVCTEVGRS